MVININQHKLKDTILDFYKATGVNISIVDANFTTISEISHGHNPYCQYIKSSSSGKCGCIRSDAALFQKCAVSRKAEMHICHAGLLDIALPIIYKYSIIAYVIMGQMKVATGFEEVEKSIQELGLDTAQTQRIYDSVPSFDENRIQAIANIAVILIKYILLENMLSASVTENIGIADQFINDNLQRELSVRDIEKGTNLSKSALYKDFHSCYNCTVKEYLNSKRIEKAAQMLLLTDVSVDEISREVGFSSAAYFSKLFKKYKGISPLKYRKSKTN